MIIMKYFFYRLRIGIRVPVLWQLHFAGVFYTGIYSRFSRISGTKNSPYQVRDFWACWLTLTLIRGALVFKIT